MRVWLEADLDWIWFGDGAQWVVSVMELSAEIEVAD